MAHLQLRTAYHHLTGREIRPRPGTLVPVGLSLLARDVFCVAGCLDDAGIQVLANVRESHGAQVIICITQDFESLLLKVGLDIKSSVQIARSLPVTVDQHLGLRRAKLNAIVRCPRRSPADADGDDAAYVTPDVNLGRINLDVLAARIAASPTMVSQVSAASARAAHKAVATNSRRLLADIWGIGNSAALKKNMALVFFRAGSSIKT